MYNKKLSPRRGTSSFGKKRSFGGSRRPFNRGPRRKNRATSTRIDERLFVNHQVTASRDTYTPKHTFSDFKVDKQILENLAQKEYITPTPIQDQAIPVALTGKDIIGIASTGTGKTAAFLIPLINKITLDRNQKIMILAPTRELALQIEKEFHGFARGLRIFSISCVGGTPIFRQMKELARGVHVVIGTPGRITDLINRGKLHLEKFTAVVLDEADRMLDMGFIDDMRFILGRIPKERQSLFFSATFSPEIKNLCKDFLNNPETISVKTQDTATSVLQDIVKVKDKSKKLDILHDILILPECSKVLIFCEMKRSVDTLQKELKARGFNALALHGDMRNRERNRAVEALRDGKAHIVIATDVAARGIDIADITHVINYDIPNNYETYIHRIGRTGRGTKTGVALTFV